MPTILMIDDDQDECGPYIDRLTRSGVEVIPASNVSEALDAIAQFGDRIDLITLDLMMPCPPYTNHETSNGVGTGLRLYRDLRSQMKNVPIVVFTLRSELSTSAVASDDRNLTVLYKLDLSPGEFAERILESIAF